MAERLESDPRAEDIKVLFKQWQDARKQWDGQAREDIDFYLGNHWTEEETDALQSMNQSNVVVDRLYSAIEQFKAIITSRPPSFRAYPREDSDNKLAQIWNSLLEYIWDISDGAEVFKQVVHDYAITGLGYFQAYLDPEADYGRGEVKISYVDPFRVYVCPSTRHRYFEDASGIIVSTILNKMQLRDTYPQLSQVPEGYDVPLIELLDAGIGEEEDYPSSNKNQNVSGAFTPDMIKDKDSYSDERGYKYRILQSYDKIKVPYFRLIDMKNGQESIVEFEEMQRMSEDGAFAAAVQVGDIQAVEVVQTRIRETATVGQIVLYQRVLNTDVYPVVPVPNVWTNTPYPMSDVRKGKDLQRFINKMHSLLTAHAQASAGLKLLIPQGSIQDIEQLERDWANPNATIEYDASFGDPHFPSPQPLASSILQLPKQVENYIDLNMGIYEMQQGNAEAAPRTASATMQLEDFGQRRSKSKLRDVEGSLKRLGRVVYNMAKKHYDFQKTFSLVNPNHDINEYTINKKIYDDKSQTIQERENSLQVGEYDIRIVGNSTMPSNRWAEWQIYLEAYQLGLIDRVEALKKTEVFDKDGVLQRIDEIEQLKQALQQAQEEVKELSGDLQTARRESVSARQRTEVEKFKGDLKAEEAKQKADSRSAIAKLESAVKLEADKLRLGTQAKVKKNSQ